MTSSRPSRLTEPSSALTRWVRRVGRTRPGTRLGRAAYDVIARRAAHRLGALEGVTRVWVTGSVARGRAQPGWSDLDLLVEATVPTLDDELRLRAALGRWLASAPMLVRHLDYAPTADLDVVLAHGGAWSVATQTSARLLWGEPRTLPRSRHDDAALEVMAVGKTLERYARTLPFMACADRGVALQAARRLWSAVEHLDGGRRPVRTASSHLRLVDEATAQLEGIVDHVTSGWPRVQEAGMARRYVQLGWRSSPAAALWILDDDAATRLRTLRTARGSEEVLSLNSKMSGAVALLDPSPLVGLAQAHRSAPALARLQPPRPLQRALALASLARLGLQARGRSLRVGVTPDEALARLRDDVYVRGPALERLCRGEEPRGDGPSLKLAGDERSLLAQLREDQQRRWSTSPMGVL